MLTLQMRVTGAEPHIVVGQLFHRTLRERFREEASLKLLVATDGKLHQYDVSLAPLSGRELAQLRLDPMAEPGSFVVEHASISRRPPPRDGSHHIYDAVAIERSWLPGPGLESLGAGRYRLRGPDAFLLSPADFAVDAGRVPICEVRLVARGMAADATARLCFGPEAMERERGCIAVRLDEGSRTQYLSLVMRPGWEGKVGMLRVDLDGGTSPAGAEIVLTSVATVPFLRENASSLLLRNARRTAEADPTGWLLRIVLLVAAAAVVVGFVEPERLKPASLLTTLGLASAVGIVVLELAFPWEAYPPASTDLLYGRTDPPGCLLILALACGLSRRLFAPPHPSLLPAVERPALLFAGVALLASLLSLDPTHSIAVWERHLGAIAAALLAGLYAPVSRRSAKLLLAGLLLGTLFVSLLGILQATGRKDTLYGDLCRTFLPIYYASNIRPKAFGTMGAPAALTTSLLALIPPAIWVAGRSHGLLRLLGLATSAASGACLLLTSSRGGAAALAIVAPLCWLSVAPARRRTLAVLGIVVALASGALILARRPRGEIRRIPSDSTAPMADGAYMRSPGEAAGVRISQRLLGARIGLSILREHPLFGAGPGMMKRLYEERLPAGSRERNPIWATTDNSYVTLLAELGLAGVASLLALLAGTTRVLAGIARAHGNDDDGSLAFATLASLVAVALHLAVYDAIYWSSPMTVAFTTLGLLLAVIDAMGRERAGEAGHRAC